MIENLCLKYLVNTSKWIVEPLLFSISCMINFGIVYIRPRYQSLGKRIWPRILLFFSIPKRVALSPTYWIFFVRLWLILSQLEISKTELPKFTPKYLNGKLCPYYLLFFINSFLYDPAYNNWNSKKFMFEIIFIILKSSVFWWGR